MAGVMLEPGESRCFTQSINAPDGKGIRLKRGTYEAKVVYFAKSKGLVEEAAEDITSNSASFTIID